MKTKKENVTGMDPTILKIIEIYVKFVIGLSALIATVMALLFIFKNPLVCIVGLVLLKVLYNEMKKQNSAVREEAHNEDL